MTVNDLIAEYEDIIADVLETSRPECYGDRLFAFTLAAARISSAELPE